MSTKSSTSPRPTGFVGTGSIILRRRASGRFPNHCARNASRASSRQTTSRRRRRRTTRSGSIKPWARFSRPTSRPRTRGSTGRSSPANSTSTGSVHESCGQSEKTYSWSKGSAAGVDVLPQYSIGAVPEQRVGSGHTRTSSPKGARIEYGRHLEKVDLKKRVLCFGDGSKVNFERLVTTTNLRHFIGMIDDVPAEVREASERLLSNQFWRVDVAVGT